MDIIEQQKISEIITAFEAYALGDIKKVKENGMPIAAFILCVCFIDQVSGYVYDNRFPGQKDNTARSKKFVSEYINQVAPKPYDKDDLIDLLRNKLVHNYSVADKKIPNHQKYALEYENPQLHMHKEGDVVLVNIKGFIDDLVNAFTLYKNQLLTDPKFQKIAIDHYDIYGILAANKIDILV